MRKRCLILIASVFILITTSLFSTVILDSRFQNLPIALTMVTVKEGDSRYLVEFLIGSSIVTSEPSDYIKMTCENADEFYNQNDITIPLSDGRWLQKDIYVARKFAELTDFIESPRIQITIGDKVLYYQLPSVQEFLKTGEYAHLLSGYDCYVLYRNAVK